jgi:hypothetical protein
LPLSFFHTQFETITNVPGLEIDAMPRWAGSPSTTVTRGWMDAVSACISCQSSRDVSGAVGGIVGEEEDVVEFK